MQERFINPQTNRDIVNAINTAKKDSFDEGKLQGIQEGKLQGIQEGKLQGIQEEKLNTARRLLSLGIPVSTIADATGLSTDDINQLS